MSYCERLFLFSSGSKYHIGVDYFLLSKDSVQVCAQHSPAGAFFCALMIYSRSALKAKQEMAFSAALVLAGTRASALVVFQKRLARMNYGLRFEWHCAIKKVREEQ